MGTYSVANLAGSAGKTTTVVSEAVLLAQLGLRVRVIDIDAQANASTWLGYPAVTGKTSADVLRRTAPLEAAERPAQLYLGVDANDKPVYDEIPNLTVVPAARETLDSLNVELPAVTGGVLHLREALDEAAPVDVTVIDSPGSLNALVIAGILATTVDEDTERAGAYGVITVTKPGPKEIEGIPALERELARIKRAYRVDVPMLCIVPCLVPGAGAVYEEQMSDLRAAYGPVVSPGIRRAGVVDAAYGVYTPVPLFGYKARDITNDYRAAISHQQSLGMFTRSIVSA